MFYGKYVFSQIVEFVDKYEFDKCVNRYFGNYRAHGLTRANLLESVFTVVIRTNYVAKFY
jgi:hypothetical protein